MTKLYSYIAMYIILSISFNTYAQTGQSKKSDSQINDEIGNHENWFPPKGNVGLNMGKNMATERFHVNGNVRVNQTIYTNSLQSATSISSTTLNLSGNGIITGYLGLGVESPTERLDVLGNMKLSGNLSARELNIQSLNSNSGIFNTLTVNQNSSFLGLSVFRENVTFSKDALVTGRLGIGVVTPSEALDVSGNIKSSAGVFSSSLNTGSADINTLNVSNNSIFKGSVGIGVITPSEKLHIGGNLKVDQSIFTKDLTTSGLQTTLFTASGVASFNDQASFAKDIFIGGKLGIGVANPVESLDVNGNLKLTGGIQAESINTSQATFSNGFTAGNSRVNGSLQVSGLISSESLSLSDITAANNVTIGNGLTVSGLSQLNGGVNAGGNSGFNNLQVNGTFNAGTISISEINTSGNATIGQDLLVNGATQVEGDFNVAGQLNGENASFSNVTTVNDAIIGNGLAVAGPTRLNGGVNVTGNSSLAGNLNVAGNLTAGSISLNDINSNGNATITQNLTVNGLSQLVGNVQVDGNLKAGVIEATEFRTTGGQSPFNFDNAVVSQTLAVGTERAVPSNYKMAVGGNIIATGIDIKIPQKWPDYVFTDGYKLLTIDEVKSFIEKHGHLPGILSAEEMKKQQDYSVAEMDVKLLEKIEELTLYIIELKKEVEQLKKKQQP